MATVLITGSNRGIGLALVREFLNQGDRVIATARHPDKAPRLQEMAAEHPEELLIAPMDVADQASVEKVRATVEEKWGELNLLVNNAGILPERGDESLAELDLKDLETAFGINVVGTVRVCQNFLPLLRKGGESRSIVNISSGAGSITDKTDSRYYCYSASKAALNQFSRALAAELKPEGIVVAAVTPGWVKTDMGGENAELAPEQSAASLVKTIKKLTLRQTGQFLDRHGRSGVYNW